MGMLWAHCEGCGRAESSNKLLGWERGELLGDLGGMLVSCRGTDHAKPWQRLPLEQGSRWWRFVAIFTLALAQCEAFGSPSLAEGMSYFITSRQDNLSSFAWKKSLTKSSKATITPDKTIIELPSYYFLG